MSGKTVSQRTADYHLLRLAVFRASELAKSLGVEPAYIARAIDYAYCRETARDTAKDQQNEVGPNWSVSDEREAEMELAYDDARDQATGAVDSMYEMSDYDPDFEKAIEDQPNWFETTERK